MKILITFILLMGPSAWAVKDGQWMAGTGILNHNLYKWTQSESGSTSFVGTSYLLPLQVRASFDVGNDWFFTPRIMYTPIGRDAPDKGSKSSILVVSLPLSQNIDDMWDWSFGLSLFMYRISGKGGSDVLNNGGGTATFYYPERSVGTKNVIAEVGISHTIGELNFGLDLFLISFLSSRRSASLLFSINYIFGEI